MAICGYNAISLISFAKQSLISAHNEITSLHLLKRCTVSSCLLQYEQKEGVLTLNWKSLRFK